MQFFNVLVKLVTAITVVRAGAITQVSNYGGSAASKALHPPFQQLTIKSDTLVVVIHCYFGPGKGGYITVWPSSNSRTCWDVSSKASLSNNGGGDSNAIANTITYALEKYKLNATRVFMTGGSFGGVAAGCFVGGGVDQWNNACANGQSTGTPEKWGDTARAMYPGYNGTQELKQWTNIVSVSMTATAGKKDTPDKGYTMSDYGPMVQGVYAQDVGHSVPSHLAASKAWLGLAWLERRDELEERWGCSKRM
ncbi:hypothetical protein BDZ45DRAFT_706573 [Acephala macrosclerotiorum]|nr:hypothetical protein BDZ45DRAFT_706573 [Acephala macrosclerotiorum]